MPDSKKYNLSTNSDLIEKFLNENKNSKSNNVVKGIINNFESERKLANISQNEAIEKLEDRQQKLNEKIEKEPEGEEKEQDMEMSKMYSFALEFLKNFFANKMDEEKKKYIQQMSAKLMENLQKSKFFENAKKFVNQNSDLIPFTEQNFGKQAKFALSSILQDKEMAKSIPTMTR